MNETVLARRTLGRAFKFDKDRPGQPDFIRVTAELSHHEGNDRPHFSVTADIWYGSHKPNGWSGSRYQRQGLEAHAGGCCHDEILQAFPELGPVVLKHLADDYGVPMHAVANGWYFYSGQAHQHDRYGQFGGLTSVYSISHEQTGRFFSPR